MIEQAGKKAGSQYLSSDLEEPTEDEWEKLAPQKIDILAKIERARTADNKPVVFCIDKIRAGLIPLEHVHEAESLFKLMEASNGKQIAYAITYIEPIGYNDRIYDLLDCDPEQS